MAPSSVVVTGCGSGIGREIITRLAADGWRTAGIEINADDAVSTREELGASHIVIIEGDAADRAIHRSMLSLRTRRQTRRTLSRALVVTALVSRDTRCGEPDGMVAFDVT